MQTWTINGQTYNHAQLMEMKKQKLNPSKDKVELKFVTPGTMDNLEKKEEKEPEQVSTSEVIEKTLDETPEQEFERLTSERAWLKKDSKERYNELKTLLNK